MPLRCNTFLNTHTTSSLGDIRVVTPSDKSINADLPQTQDYFASASKPRISVPPQVDLVRNIQEAQLLGPLLNPVGFYNKVKSKAEWDYKRLDKKGTYEDFGNYHFGVMAAAGGWPKDLAKRGAGFYQIKSLTSKPEFGLPFEMGVHSYFGDDPRDQMWIEQGYNDYLQYMRQGADPCYWERLPYLERDSSTNYFP